MQDLHTLWYVVLIVTEKGGLYRVIWIGYLANQIAGKPVHFSCHKIRVFTYFFPLDKQSVVPLCCVQVGSNKKSRHKGADGVEDRSVTVESRI